MFPYSGLPLLPLMMFVGLSACGGTEGDLGATTPPVDYSTYTSQAAALHTQWDTVAATDPSTLPLGGNANFNGVMGLRLQTSGSELRAQGALGLNVSFASDSLSGSAGGFSDENGKPVSGNLSITGGVLDRLATLGSQYTFTANIDGTLIAVSDSFVIVGDIHGDFSGMNSGAALGIVAGTAQSGFGTGYVFGDFIAEQ